MENNEEIKSPDRQQEKGSKKIIVVLIIILLLLANVFLLWQFFNKNTQIITLSQTTDVLTSQKDSLNADLEKTIADLENIRLENEGLRDQLTETESVLQAKQAEIQRMIKSGELVK